MAKTATVLLGAAAVGAVGLYLVGPPISRSGSGIWPTFVSSEPNYDALEAHRARQRAEAPPVSAPSPAAAPINAGPVDPEPRAVEEGEAALAAPDTERLAPLRSAAGYWPDFRGPVRDGHYTATPIRTDWPSDGLPELWKQPIGLGYASIVVADGRAFTIEQRRDREVVAAYDVMTGLEVWTHGWEGEFVEYQGGNGPRATPTYHEGRLYALGALGELRALDAATGALVWRRNILDDAGASNLDWGMAASPLVVDDTVVVLPGGRDGASVVAYDLDRGDQAWRALDDRQAYTSPMLVTLAGMRQILIVSAERALGLTVDGERVLWDHPWVTDFGINVAQPILLGGDRVFLSAGYGHGAAVIEIVPDGSAFTARTVWQNIRMKNRFSSSVFRDGYIYGLDESILACVDAATGELQWKGGRYGHGQILLAGDHLVVLSEDGDVVLVRATPERHEELARFHALDGRTWNHPVIAGGRLLVRNLREMAAFDLRP